MRGCRGLSRKGRNGEVEHYPLIVQAKNVENAGDLPEVGADAPGVALFIANDGTLRRCTLADVVAYLQGQIHAAIRSHADQHASGGTDPVTPESIGAAPKTHTHNGTDGDTFLFLSGAFGISFRVIDGYPIFSLENYDGAAAGRPLILRNVYTPQSETDAANKAYVDGQSPYKKAVEFGYTGTEAAFGLGLARLMGVSARSELYALTYLHDGKHGGESRTDRETEINVYGDGAESWAVINFPELVQIPYSSGYIRIAPPPGYLFGEIDMDAVAGGSWSLGRGSFQVAVEEDNICLYADGDNSPSVIGEVGRVKLVKDGTA